MAGLEEATPVAFRNMSLAAGQRPVHLACTASDGDFCAASVLLQARADLLARSSDAVRIEVLSKATAGGEVGQLEACLERVPHANLCVVQLFHIGGTRVHSA